MKNQKLKLLANDNIRYPNIELLNSKPPFRRFIGWNIVNVNVDGELRTGFNKKTEPETVNFHNDYVDAVKRGDLLPGDTETAKMCGVSFEAEQIKNKG